MTMNFMTLQPVPYRPAISNVLVKASANRVFRTRLLSSPREALLEMNLPPEDVELLANIRAQSLSDYAEQLKMKLLSL